MSRCQRGGMDEELKRYKGQLLAVEDELAANPDAQKLIQLREKLARVISILEHRAEGARRDSLVPEQLTKTLSIGGSVEVYDEDGWRLGTVQDFSCDRVHVLMPEEGRSIVITGSYGKRLRVVQPQVQEKTATKTPSTGTKPSPAGSHATNSGNLRVKKPSRDKESSTLEWKERQQSWQDFTKKKLGRF